MAHRFFDTLLASFGPDICVLHNFKIDWKTVECFEISTTSTAQIRIELNKSVDWIFITMNIDRILRQHSHNSKCSSYSFLVFRTVWTLWDLRSSNK